MTPRPLDLDVVHARLRRIRVRYVAEAASRAPGAYCSFNAELLRYLEPGE